MANRENIFLRKDGRFEARYRKGRNNNGKLIYGFCYGKTYEEAQEKARRLQKAACAAEGGGQEETTFAHYCDGWLISNKRRLKESSSAKYLADIKNHIIPFFGKKLPWEITSEETDLFVQLLLYEKKLSPKTVRNILALFHSVYVYAGRRSGRKLAELEIIYPRQQKKKYTRPGRRRRTKAAFVSCRRNGSLQIRRLSGPAHGASDRRGLRPAVGGYLSGNPHHLCEPDSPAHPKL